MKIASLDNRGIPYIIKETKQNKISISVKNDGTIIVKRNRYIKESKVIDFVNDHIVWIEKAYLKHYQPPRKFISGEEYLLMGKTHHLKIIYSSKDLVEVDFEKQIINIYTTSTAFSHFEMLMDKYLKKLSLEIFSVLLEDALNKTKPFFEIHPLLYIKHYKSRWGCCVPKDNKIVLNQALIHVDLDLISFVILHELCHFKYLNHSKEFHQTLMQFAPNEKELRKRLNKFSPEYH